jgi:flagellar motor switch/type III secretory pathway protein FliN
MESPPEKPRTIRSYPWESLAAVPREALGALRDARRAVAAAVDVGALGTALSELTGALGAVRVARVEVTAEDAPSLGGVSLALGTPDDALRLCLELDAELARAMVARVIGRPLPMGHPSAAPAAELEGAALAVVLGIARRAHGSSTPLVPFGRGAWRIEPGRRRLRIDAAVTLERDAYAVRATIELGRAIAATPRDPVAQLASLGRLPITLPLVAAVSLASMSDVARLAIGDVWLPLDGWTARLDGASARLMGAAVLAPASSARGIGVKLGDAGEIVVLGEKTLLLDVEKTMPTPNQDQTATSEIVLDAPLVVRVEVGAVTLSAAEWAALANGDVIALGRRVSEPVLLRIAGAEVARGELVEIEGELGVRIRERPRST